MKSYGLAPPMRTVARLVPAASEAIGERAFARVAASGRPVEPCTSRVAAAQIAPRTRETTSALLSQAREKPECLTFRADPKREPRSFILTLARPMGSKRGKAEGSFVRETRAQTFDFYRDLVQNLKQWQARPPKLRDTPAPEDVPDTPQPDPPPFVAADLREVSEGENPEDHGS